ncbi:MAG: hypothetical protein JW791_00865 [Nanoarchaeota archaeon]|nr:hypothetical protein [Nanoarchaeota archaeon]
MDKRFCLLLAVLILPGIVFAQEEGESSLTNFIAANFNLIISIALFLIVFTSIFSAASAFTDNFGAQMIIAFTLGAIVAISNVYVPVLSTAIKQFLFDFPYNIFIIIGFALAANILSLILDKHQKDEQKTTKVITILLLISAAIFLAFYFDLIVVESSNVVSTQEGGSSGSSTIGMIIVFIFFAVAIFFGIRNSANSSSYSGDGKKSKFFQPSTTTTPSTKPEKAAKTKKVKGIRRTVWESIIKNPTSLEMDYTYLLDQFNKGKISDSEKIFISDLLDLKKAGFHDEGLKLDKNASFAKLLSDASRLRSRVDKGFVLENYWKAWLVMKSLMGEDLKVETVRGFKRILGALNEEKKGIRDLLEAVKKK